MSKATTFLGFTIVATIATIAYVHYDQERELKRMRQGVFLDAIREEERRKAVAKSNSSAVINDNISRQDDVTQRT